MIGLCHNSHFNRLVSQFSFQQWSMLMCIKMQPLKDNWLNVVHTFTSGVTLPLQTNTVTDNSRAGDRLSWSPLPIWHRWVLVAIYCIEHFGLYLFSDRAYCTRPVRPGVSLGSLNKNAPSSLRSKFLVSSPKLLASEFRHANLVAGELCLLIRVGMISSALHIHLWQLPA